MKAWGNFSKISATSSHHRYETDPCGETLAAIKISRTDRTRFSTGCPFTSDEMTPELVVSVEAGASKLIRLYAVLKARINRRS